MSSSVHKLFGEAAARYDLHTPPGHYHHDHRFVLEELRQVSSSPRVLDVGCGTGVFLQYARDAGADIRGTDISPEMVAVAETRLGPGVVRVERMQDLEETEAYDAVVCLSWSFHYCASAADAADVLSRFFRALRPGGLLVVQGAHAANATGRLLEDREPGPSGEPDDVQFLYRFTSLPGPEPRLVAQYVYSCRSLDELVAEDHVLSVADVPLVADLAREAGFDNVRIYDDWRRAPFSSSLAPLMVTARPAAR
jgi:SAM-dependent methyltransferase